MPHSSLSAITVLSLAVLTVIPSLAASISAADAQSTDSDTPTVITLGKATYASAPPAVSKQMKAFFARGPRLDPSVPAGTPTPSNDWWTHPLFSPEVGRLWAYPLTVGADAKGVEVYLPELDPKNNKDFKVGIPLTVQALDGGNAIALPAACQTALRWGDWTVTLRLREDDARYLDMTTGRGLPFVWVEAHGLSLGINAPADLKGNDAKNPDVITGFDGKPMPEAGAAGALITRDGRHFAVYAVGGKLVAGANGGLRPAPGAAVTALAVAAIPDGVDANSWRPAALAIPRDSTFAWTYNRAAGRIDTTWTLHTEPLGAGAGEPLQGWLPHQWRTAPAETTFAAGEFRTPRGRLRLQSGSVFHWSWKFMGVLPALPPPAAGGEAPQYDPQRLAGYLDAYTADRVHGDKGKPKAGGDTYWGGKDVLQFAQTGLIATAVGDKNADAIHGAAVSLLSDWFTWAPGKKERYFARYPKLGALIGFNPSYGSETFTDNHFHYGYFTMACAMAMKDDPAFRDGYGAMAKLVAKQYANWDRKDTAFPFLRTFEPWTGHSYAGGESSGDGNNQESSSESMQSWGGLCLLGAVLGDTAMEDCGAMGYAIEGEATKEYWNDYYAWKQGPAAANLPPGYGHPIVGIVGDSGNAFGTFFNGQPRFIYGIQWLPLTPALQFLGWDPAFGKVQWDNLLREQRAIDPKFALETLDGGWDHVALGYLMVNDPEKTAKTFETLWEAKSPIATNAQYNPVTYYLLHAWRALGTIDPEAWADQATACVYRKADGRETLVAWNPGATPMAVTVHRADGVAGQTTVAPGGLVAWAVPGK